MRSDSAVGSWHHDDMDTALVERTLRATDATLWAGLVTTDQLPVVGAALLADGVDTPSLVLLAGLDLSPFEPRDARELFEAVLAEAAIKRPTVEERIGLVCQAVGSLYSQGRLNIGRAWYLCAEFAIPSDHTHHDVVRLYSLQDEWEGSWGRPKREVEAEVHELIVGMAEGEPPYRALAEAIVAKRK